MRERLRQRIAGLRSVSVANIVLGAILVLAAGTVVYGIGTVSYADNTDKYTERYTELYLLSGNEAEDGQVAAVGYPTALAVDESTRLTAGVENHEGTAQSYTLTVQLQRVDANSTSASGEPIVTETQHIGQFSRLVGPNESWEVPHQIIPNGAVVGERVRLTYLLYRGEAPREPTTENAYRTVHIWVTVDDI